MKDIEKMRQEFERKIKCAEMSNKIEAEVGIECDVMEHGSCTQKGKEWLYFSKVTKEQAGKILKMFPWTERSKTRGHNGQDIEISYVLSTSRSPKELLTTLDISWIHNEWNISMNLPIDPTDHILMQYFKRDSYEIDNSTIGLYFGAVSEREKGYLKNVSLLSFNCGDVVRFYGGHHKQVSEGHAERIVAEIIGE